MIYVRADFSSVLVFGFQYSHGFYTAIAPIVQRVRCFPDYLVYRCADRGALGDQLCGTANYPTYSALPLSMLVLLSQGCFSFAAFRNLP